MGGGLRVGEIQTLRLKIPSNVLIKAHRPLLPYRILCNDLPRQDICIGCTIKSIDALKILDDLASGILQILF
ncbi:hypothetical protein C8R41DRAFT_820788 [Lentinula lateritia]|uniref:Uncharacterized protein n=1 Tax=Lentinula lateritia TaxID=40482 RepID=A0ABQ8VQ32_9AGAR|nr:hypothetical protein C8R41DRAFT_820788 [Lentinula lateritia]